MHFFNIATNLTNGPFMIGYESEADNFYLKGETIKDSPAVSCRIFSSKGELMFSMIRNQLGPEGNNISIKLENSVLFVTDHDQNLLLKIETRNEKSGRVTYIQGNFYDKDGKLAAKGDERGLIVNCPLRM
jgi:hypothetical protein